MLTSRDAVRTPRRTELGGIALTMLVLMIVVLASSALVIRSLDGLRDTRRDGDRAGATAAAEIALAEAMARIDLGATSSFSGTDVVGAGTSDEIPLRWEAVRNSDGSWSLYAEAGVDDGRRALQALVSRTVAPPRTLFAVDALRLWNNTGIIQGTIGTNGTLSAVGSDLGDRQELAGPAASCTGCDNPIPLSQAVTIENIVVPPAPIQACPVDGVFTGRVNGRAGTPVVCLDPSVPVSFVDEVFVDNGPLVIHVGPQVEVVLDGARINEDLDASELQLTLDSDSAPARFSADFTLMKGVINAPGRTLETEAFALRGSLVIGTFLQPDGAFLTMDDDAAIADTGDVTFELAGWEPIPPRP